MKINHTNLFTPSLFTLSIYEIIYAALFKDYQLFFYDIILRNAYFTSYRSTVVKVYVYMTVLDRHKIQDSGLVLPYLLSNEARLPFNL